MGGRQIGGVSGYPVSGEALALYEAADALIARQPKPMLFSRSDRDARMFFANFDGSGQDMDRAGAIRTNIGEMQHDLRQRIRAGDTQLAAEYLPGPGTQPNPLSRGADSLLGFTADERVEAMYRRLARRSQVWLDANPNADITLAATGYSRGAISAVMLTRLVDRYGILDPEGLRFGRDANGDLTVESDRPPLVPPGRTAQALALLDPVSTGIDRDFDLRPPPSVISGLSIWARDERRGPFRHHAVIDLGLGEDGRFAGVLVPGAHSDVGGGNRLNGLELRAGNLLRQYVNGLSDAPLLGERPVPADPSNDVVHRSHQALMGAFEIGSARAGSERGQREDLCVVVDPCRDAEPRDEALAARYFNRVPGMALPDAVARIDDPSHAGYPLYRAARDGLARIDDQHGVADATGSDRAAAALAVAARDAGMTRIGHVLLGHDRDRLFAVDADDLHSPLRRIAHVDVVPARLQPLEASTQRFDAAGATETRVQAPAQEPVVETTRAMPARALAH